MGRKCWDYGLGLLDHETSKIDRLVHLAMYKEGVNTEDFTKETETFTKDGVSPW